MFVVIHGVGQTELLPRDWTLYQVDSSPNHHLSQTCLLSNKNKLIGGPPTNSRVIIQAVSPPQLEQVIVLCPPEIYASFGLIAHDELMLQLYNSLSSKIIRQGEYSPFLKGFFKLCEPVDQGILTKKTKLIVLKDQPLNLNHQNNHMNGQLEDLEVEIEKYISFNDHLSVIDEHIPITLSVQALINLVSVSSIVPSPELKDDPESRGFVGFEQLATIGCFSGDVVCDSF